MEFFRSAAAKSPEARCFSADLRRDFGRDPIKRDHPPIVIPGLDPGISLNFREMAGASPAMTDKRVIQPARTLL